MNFTLSRWAGRRDGYIQFLKATYGEAYASQMTPTQSRILSELGGMVSAATEAAPDEVEYDNGLREALYITSLPAENADMLLYIHDFTPDSPELPEQIAARKALKRRHTRIALSIAAIAVLFVIVWFLPPVREYRAYKALTENPNYYYYCHYLEQFPDGSHRAQADELMEKVFRDCVNDWKTDENMFSTDHRVAVSEYLEFFKSSPYADDIAWTLAERAIKENETPLYFRGEYYNGKYLIDAFNDYLEEFPTGAHAARANALSDSIREVNFAYITSHTTLGKTAKGREFLSKMFDYMKKHRTTNLAVSSESVNKLQDYDDLSPAQKSYVNSQKYPTQQVLPIKSNFTNKAVENIRIGALAHLTSAFEVDSVKDFINIIHSDEPDSISPAINLTMTIQNRCDVTPGMPSVYLFVTEKDPRKLAVHPFGESSTREPVFVPEVIFDTEIFLPDTGETFKFREKGAGFEDQSNLSSLSEGYERYCTIAAKNYPSAI